MRLTQTRSGAKARRPKRGQSHLFSCAEGAKEVSEPAEPGKPEQVNVARRKDGGGQTGGTADVCTRTVGRGRRPQSRRAAGNGAGQRHAGGEAKIKPRRAVFLEEFRACRGILHGPDFGKKI